MKTIFPRIIQSILIYHNNIAKNVFLFERFAKSIMTDALNPGWGSYFCEFCDNLGLMVARGAGIQSPTLRSPARCHGNLPRRSPYVDKLRYILYYVDCPNKMYNIVKLFPSNLPVHFD